MTSTAPFDTNTDPETEFRTVLDREILPIYRQTREEGQAKARHARLWSRGILLLGFLVALGIWLWFPFEPDTPNWILSLFVLIISAILAGVIFQQTKRRFNNVMKEAIGPILARQIGVTEFQIKPGGTFMDLQALHHLHILPFFNRTQIEDGLAGTWRDVRYKLAEVHLRRKSRSGGKQENDKLVTVFKGLTLEIETPVDMPWIVFEAGPRGLLGKVEELTNAARGLHPVDYGIGDTAPFRVYSEDPGGTPELVPALFLETLVQIAAHHEQQSGRIEAGFKGRTFYLCLRRNRRFLEVDAFETEEKAFIDSCRTALTDMALPSAVIDLLIDGPNRQS